MAHGNWNFVKITDMLIFNGRIGDDHGVGQFTRDDTTGRSVVDYAIGTPVIFNQIDSFKVLGKFPESNHVIDITAYKIGFFLVMTQMSGQNGQLFINIPGPKARWHERIYRQQCSMITIILIMVKWSKCMYNLDDTDIVANKFDQYIAQACDRVLLKYHAFAEIRRALLGMILSADSNGHRRLRLVSGSLTRNRNSAGLQPVANTAQLSNASSAHTSRNVLMILNVPLGQTALTCGVPLVACVALAPLTNLVMMTSSIILNVSILQKKNIILLMILRI